MLKTQSVPLGNSAEAGARSGASGARSPHWLGWLSLPIGLGLLLILWAALSRLYPPFILPGPADVAARFVQAAADGTLFRHLGVTFVEALLGFTVGFIVAVVLGYGIAKQPLVERIISPYVVASQAVPIVALAPLLILWFGHGLASKVLVCALVVFFPILVNTVVALRSVDPQSRELMHSLNASPWHTFTKLELPASLPIMFGGIRMGVTLCVIGAVVGEFVGADTGLGALVNLARGMFDTSLMFVALFTLIALAMSLYLLVTLVERLVTRP
ncbi:MAG: ABC transporter permease [Anaerolineae bacterium]